VHPRRKRFEAAPVRQLRGDQRRAHSRWKVADPNANRILPLYCRSSCIFGAQFCPPTSRRRTSCAIRISFQNYVLKLDGFAQAANGATLI